LIESEKMNEQVEVDNVEYVDHENMQTSEEMPYIPDTVVITHENFHVYFSDVKKSKPQKGQVLAKYSAMAELIKGDDKNLLIKMLMEPDKAIAAAKYMQSVLLATEGESFRVSREIAGDIIAEAKKDRNPWKRILSKPYRFQIEAFFYTWPECIPEDPHWECITLKNLDKFLDTVVQEAVENANELIE
jgi:hypothetical protein